MTKKQPDIFGIGEFHHSYAPLLVRRKMYGFLSKKNAEGDSVELAQTEIQEACFRVLGYLEEYQRILRITELPSSQLDLQHVQTEKDLLKLLLSEGSQENNEEGEDSIEDGDMREHIAGKIRALLGNTQVREYFLENLKEEVQRYRASLPKLKVVAGMRFAQSGASRKIIREYLGSKKKHGKLVQSSADNILKYEQLKEKARKREEAERQSANETERGFLKAQELLQYKEQIRKKGFALTPSRKKLVEKIARQVLAGKKVFLVGSTGTGKTELAMYVADDTSGRYEMVSWHEGTTPRDLFGYRELWTNEEGKTESGTKPGPVTKAVTDGAVAIHDEYTTGTTRSQIAAKAFMNAKPGQNIHIPGFNGQVFEVSQDFAEIFTGNPKDERTQAREDMDPAILRMMTGLKIDYMPAEEMKDIILANVIEDNGVLRLSPSEVELIGKLCNAAELMQMFHDRAFDDVAQKLGAGSAEFSTLKSVFGGDIKDARLDKHFLDPGTLFGMFRDFDLTRASGGSLKAHLESVVADFLVDPKSNVPEEKILMRKILEICGVIKKTNAGVKVKLKSKTEEPDYLLPSQLATLGAAQKDDTDIFDQEGEDEKAKEIMGKNFTGPAEWKQNLGVEIKGDIPPIPWSKEVFLSACPFESGKMIAETHTLFLLPKSFSVTRDVNGTPRQIEQELTVWNWRSLIKQAQGANQAAKMYGSDTDRWYKDEAFAKTTMDEMQWCLLPKNMVPGSTSKNYAQQDALLANHPEYETPTALMEVSKQFLHYLNTGEMLNSKYAWCSDETSDGNRVYVGGFDSGGLNVGGCHPDDSSDRLGRAAARKFS